jgi:hypothetical protein
MLLEYVRGLDLLLSFEPVMFMDLLKCCCNVQVMVMKYDLICCWNLELKGRGISVQILCLLTCLNEKSYYKSYSVQQQMTILL